MDLSDRRESYETAGLDIGDVSADPVEQFGRWYRDAEAADLWEPNAMVVSAVDADGLPGSRFVLLKSFGADGFTFYTNYTSDKATALDAAGAASLTFGWLALRRQVRLVGAAERVSAAESDEYFATRPRGSQIGAWASPQSDVVADRAELDRRYAEVEERFAGVEIPRPAHWGGYRVRPHRIEFWQGRPDRFHDRLLYTQGDGGWEIRRLAP